jgi:hypothetical protein
MWINTWRFVTRKTPNSNASSNFSLLGTKRARFSFLWIDKYVTGEGERGREKRREREKEGERDGGGEGE